MKIIRSKGDEENGRKKSFKYHKNRLSEEKEILSIRFEFDPGFIVASTNDKTFIVRVEGD